LAKNVEYLTKIFKEFVEVTGQDEMLAASILTLALVMNSMDYTLKTKGRHNGREDMG